MSDYGVFEASSTDGHEEEQRQRQATRDLGRAIESAREGFGDFLGAATDKQDYQDRLALVMNDLMQKVADSGVMPVPGVMRKVKAALRPQFRTAAGLDEFENMLRANWGASFSEFLNEFDAESQRDARDEFKNTFGVTDADLNGFLPSIGASRKQSRTEDEIRKARDDLDKELTDALDEGGRGDEVKELRQKLRDIDDELSDSMRQSSRKQASDIPWFTNHGGSEEVRFSNGSYMLINPNGSWQVGDGTFMTTGQESSVERAKEVATEQLFFFGSKSARRKTAGDLDDFESWVSEEANSVYDSTSASRYLSTFPSGEEPFDNDPDALLYAYENQFAEASRKRAGTTGGGEEVDLSNPSSLSDEDLIYWASSAGGSYVSDSESDALHTEVKARGLEQHVRDVQNYKVDWTPPDKYNYFGNRKALRKTSRRKQAYDSSSIPGMYAQWASDAGLDPHDSATLAEFGKQFSGLSYDMQQEISQEFLSSRKQADAASDTHRFVLYLQGVGFRQPKDAGRPGGGGEMDDELYDYFQGNQSTISEVSQYLNDNWDYYAYGIGASRKQGSAYLPVVSVEQDTGDSYMAELKGGFAFEAYDEGGTWVWSIFDNSGMEVAGDETFSLDAAKDDAAYALERVASRKQAYDKGQAAQAAAAWAEDLGYNDPWGFASWLVDKGPQSYHSPMSDSEYQTHLQLFQEADDPGVYGSRKRAFSEQLGVHLTEVFESGEAGGGWRQITGERLDWEKGDLEFYGGSGFFRDWSLEDDGGEEVFAFSTNDDSVIIDAAWKAVDYANGIRASRKTATPKDTLIFDSLSELLLNGGLSPEDEDAIERAYDQAEQGKWQAAYNSVTFVADGPDLSAGADRLVESILDDIESLVGDPSRKVDSRRKQAENYQFGGGWSAKVVYDNDDEGEYAEAILSGPGGVEETIYPGDGRRFEPGEVQEEAQQIIDEYGDSAYQDTYQYNSRRKQAYTWRFDDMGMGDLGWESWWTVPEESAQASNGVQGLVVEDGTGKGGYNWLIQDIATSDDLQNGNAASVEQAKAEVEQAMSRYASRK